MKAAFRNREGLTLVELIVSMAIGSMIMLAAVTVLLLGFRINHRTTETVTQQYTARTVVTLLEKLAEEGKFNKVVMEPDGGWKIGSGEQFSSVLMSYDATKQAIYVGDTPSNGNQNPPILEGIVASYILWEPKTNENNQTAQASGESEQTKAKQLEYGLLTITLQDEQQSYRSVVCCRVNMMDGKTHQKDAVVQMPSIDEKLYFLNVLNSQMGMQGGLINTKACPGFQGEKCEVCSNFQFFSEWYTDVEGYGPNYTASGWSPDTPWCACFVSWGLAHVMDKYAVNKDGTWVYEGNLEGIRYANVDTFMQAMQDTKPWKDGTAVPEPGDLVFFNMIDGDEDDPSHMGVVFEVKDGTVRTIEGNSADTVAYRTYNIGDPRILGYVDPWTVKN